MKTTNTDTLKRSLVVLCVITAVVTICFILFAYILLSSFTAQLAPKEGIWYSDALCLQLSFDPDGESVWHTQNGDIPCTFYSHPQDKYISVYEIAETILTDEGTAYRDGDKIMVFQILDYEDTLLLVQDALGNEYAFSPVH